MASAPGLSRCYDLKLKKVTASIRRCPFSAALVGSEIRSSTFTSVPLLPARRPQCHLGVALLLFTEVWLLFLWSETRCPAAETGLFRERSVLPQDVVEGLSKIERVSAVITVSSILVLRG